MKKKKKNIGSKYYCQIEFFVVSMYKSTSPQKLRGVFLDIREVSVHEDFYYTCVIQAAEKGRSCDYPRVEFTSRTMKFLLNYKPMARRFENSTLAEVFHGVFDRSLQIDGFGE